MHGKLWTIVIFQYIAGDVEALTKKLLMEVVKASKTSNYSHFLSHTLRFRIVSLKCVTLTTLRTGENAAQL